MGFKLIDIQWYLLGASMIIVAFVGLILCEEFIEDNPEFLKNKSKEIKFKPIKVHKVVHHYFREKVINLFKKYIAICKEKCKTIYLNSKNKWHEFFSDQKNDYITLVKQKLTIIKTKLWDFILTLRRKE